MCTLFDTYDMGIHSSHETTDGICRFLHGKMFSCSYHIQTLAQKDEFSCEEPVYPFVQNFSCSDHSETFSLHD